MAEHNITARADDQFIHIQAFPGLHIADVAPILLIHHVCQKFLRSGGLRQSLHPTLVQAIHNGLAVEGALALKSANTARNAGVVENVHSAAVYQAGIIG